jgi:hypothetical protein
LNTSGVAIWVTLCVITPSATIYIGIGQSVIVTGASSYVSAGV